LPEAEGGGEREQVIKGEVPDRVLLYSRVAVLSHEALCISKQLKE
jgi:hypothetical protein